MVLKIHLFLQFLKVVGSIRVFLKFAYVFNILKIAWGMRVGWFLLKIVWGMRVRWFLLKIVWGMRVGWFLNLYIFLQFPPSCGSMIKHIISNVAFAITEIKYFYMNLTYICSSKRLVGKG